MIEYKLNIGEVVTSSSRASYTCYGLGSCIGLFIQDRVAKLSGGAHIFLPESEVGAHSPFSSVTNAIDEILRQLKLNGSTLQTLRAKVAGGANVLGSGYSVGERNARSVMKELIDRKIFVAAQDLGGTHCRTVTFESDSGLLRVSKPQLNELQTY